ncbi:MAG TPA: hypothetical protein VE641_07380, partial [Chthoniobacterales bacterium]|nr:hypothetical protein [Chthoniobacterales bacterium]
TPSLRLAGFEDEDDDEYENEPPCEGGSPFIQYEGLEIPGLALSSLRDYSLDEPSEAIDISPLRGFTRLRFIS